VKILLVTATQEELGGAELAKKLQSTFSDLEILYTGVGMAKATYSLTSSIYFKKPDFILHTGICGSFKKSFPIGTVLNVLSEEFADIGFNDNGKFIPITEKDVTIYNGIIKNLTDWGQIIGIPSVKGITVNTVNGEKSAIEKVVQQYHPDIESMEGAAISYVCLKQNIPFAEIRAVSNFVEPRNVQNWNIPLAIKNLTAMLPEILHKIQSHYEA
jgi:futalosine hydrolase